ncbi:MAG: Amidohydrolase [Syntrophus sp. PtaB.Bin001]|nr:MAG: Amidohydrolase [Syntrophus sp. PtaB.Bin001]
MKVIDFHVHPAPVKVWKSWVVDYFRQNNPDTFQSFADGLTPAKLMTFFASQGVSSVVVLAEYAPKCTGVMTNEETARYCQGRENLIPFAAISLEDGTPYEEQARYAVEELGMKGFKLLPSYQHFYPNDPSFFPFYEYVQSKGLPIMFHTGSSVFRGSRIKYADPLLLDDVADEFPDLPILLEHGGRPFWYDHASWMLTRHCNVHIGIAGIAIRHLPRLFPNLEKFSDRFIFGSDWPGMYDVKGLVDRVKALPYADETKAAILHGNAERLLGKAKNA